MAVRYAPGNKASVVAAITAAAGAQKQRLFTIGHRTITSVNSDASGRNLVFATVGFSPRSREEPRLWRWSKGDRAPSQLGAGGLAGSSQWAAAWVPQA